MSKNSGGSGLANNSIIIIIGLIASCIGIFAFVTGKQSLGLFSNGENNSPVFIESTPTDVIQPENTPDISPADTLEPATILATPTAEQLVNINLLHEISVINTYGSTTDVLSFSSDGGQFGIGCGQDVCIYDTTTGSLIKRLYGHQNTVNAVSFSPNTQYLASGSKDGDILIWNLSNADSPISRIHQMESWGDPEYAVYAIAFLPDNNTIAVADSSMDIHVYSSNSGELIQSLKLENNYTNRLSVSSDGKYVAGTSGYQIVSVWELATGRKVFDWESSGDPIFSPDGSSIALSNSNGGGINLYSVSGGNIKMRFTGDSQKDYQAYSFSPSGDLIFGCRDDLVDVWQVSDGNLLAELGIDTDSGTASWCWDVQVSPDGKHLATVTFGGPLRIWSFNVQK